MYKLILVILLSVSLIGCSSHRQPIVQTYPMFVDPVPRPFLHPEEPPVISPNTITSKEIANLFTDSGVMTADETYWKPSKDWVFSAVYPYYKKFLDDQDVTYSSRFDCDDFARTFCVMAQLYYYNYEKENQEQGVAVAEVHYHPESALELIPYIHTSNHAINAIIIDDGTVIFFEPQTGQQVVLTEKEKKSIYLVKF